ncbi:hypothetical protein [Paenibacillus albus]|uniref:Uncharacterized protein n=1 Tax=Paenibacillus albus TaxID=2495582 RepID=A0A3S8ZYM4_9BACL|nr:hypothetical protein [Paenibacillus albus]AZN38591.1 hypothetical protein EJC50_02050 [Paenibacillus albus]
MRKMKRWKKVLIWIISIVVIIGAAGLFAANYATNKVIGSLADSLETEISDEPVDTSSTAGAQEDKDADSSKASDTVDSKDSSQSTSSSSSNQSNNAKDEVKSSADVTPPAKEDTSKYAAEVSVDKAKTVKDKITIKDKATVASILMKKLSVQDIKKLQKLASGGLTIAKKREARQIILGAVSPDQYNELSGIAKKYGVSQGKKYDEVIKQK